jgi:hypothetical protein
MQFGEERGNLFHLKVGDPVMVQGHSKATEAEVVKRGRVYIAVKRMGYTRTDEFDMERGSYRYEGDLKIFTMEQYAANTRRKNVIVGLRDAGFDLRASHSLSLETLEKVLDLVQKEAP